MSTAVKSAPIAAPVVASTDGHHSDGDTPPPTHREDPLRSINEVARQLGRHHSTVMQWAVDGLFEVVPQPAGRFCVRQSVINKFLKGTTFQREIE